MIDYRCPACNRPVKGRQDVTVGTKPTKNISQCQHCETFVTGKIITDDLGPCYSFSVSRIPAEAKANAPANVARFM